MSEGGLNPPRRGFRTPAESPDGPAHPDDHLALIYEDRAEQFAAVVPFIRQGLERGEQCLYVADENTEAEVIDALRRGGIDVGAALESGALSVHTKADTYHRTGEFDREAMLEFWERALDQTTDDGYTGIRAAAEMTWALDGDTPLDLLAEYEAVLNDLYEGEDYAVLCQYNRNRFPPDVLHDIVRTHPFVVHDGAVNPNIFYTPPEEFLGPDRRGAELDRLLDALDERRDHERELQERTEHLSTLIETAPDCIKTVAADGTLLGMNPAGLEFGEVDAESDVVGECIFDFVAPEDRERYRAFTERVCQGERDSLEFDIIGLEGTRRHLKSHGAPLRRPNGSTIMVAVTRDVTERIEQERDLERARDLLAQTERIADVGGWEIDVETMDVFWTDHIFELLELDSEDEPPLEEALDMYHDEDRPIVVHAIENALAAGEPFDIEARIYTDSDEIRWLRLKGVPETDDGEVVSVRGAAQDITARKEREQRLEEVIDRLEASNDRLEQFAYAASHDLQEPLRMVSTYLQLLEDRRADELDDEAVEYLEFAVDGADRMRALVDDLLAFSRVEQADGTYEPVDCEALLDRVQADLQAQVEETDAEIQVGSLPTVMADGEQLEQLFFNLVSNAIKYRGDDAPRVEIAVEQRADRWEFSVRDNGIGIDPDKHDRIFAVFKRLHHDDEYPGTGIGLSLCQQIVENHGGDIWVESEPAEGSTFSFTIPTGSER